MSWERKDCFVDGEPDRPHAFVQWKGTDVCMDVYCECGEQGHVDSEFAYAVRCPKCGTTYEVGCHVALRKVERWTGCRPRSWDLDREGDEIEEGLHRSVATLLEKSRRFALEAGAAGTVDRRELLRELEEVLKGTGT